MQALKYHILMFLLGLRDSVSIQWVTKIMLYTDPRSKKIHPLSHSMLSLLKQSIVQVAIFLIAIPGIFLLLEIYSLYYFLNSLFLLLTYGYLFFYNDQIMTVTRQIALWKIQNYPGSLQELDQKQKIDVFLVLSSQIKSFIFLLLYYVPIFFSISTFTNYFPVLGSILLLISQSFFNSVFYFLKKWPYDRYNLGYIEANIGYMLGFGFTVSFICNILLGGLLARGAYLLLSIWMIINCVLFSPPSSSFEQVYMAVLNYKNNRKNLNNGYNQHRKKIRNDPEYRKTVTKQIFLVKPSFDITAFINSKIEGLLSQQHNMGRPKQEANSEK